MLQLSAIHHRLSIPRYLALHLFFFLFFQGEDGIRDSSVTGVQTCALPICLRHYEEVRSVEVLKIQNAARNSTEWFENVERYAGLEPEQFAYSLLTRSQRISHENLQIGRASCRERV